MVSKRSKIRNASLPELWPSRSVALLLQLVDRHRQKFSECEVIDVCRYLSELLPNNPRRPDEKYSSSEIRKKFRYLMFAKNSTWDDIAQHGSKALTWNPKKGSSRPEETHSEVDDNNLDGYEPATIVAEEDEDHSNQEQYIARESHEEFLGSNVMPLVEIRGRRRTPEDVPEQIQYGIDQSENQKLCDSTYVNFSPPSLVITDPQVSDRVGRILSKMNMVVSYLSKNWDFNTVPSPDWDMIQIRYPKTSDLLFKVIGVANKGRLSEALANLGLGCKSLHVWMKALIGMAIHSWVFESSFPTSLTRPERSLEIVANILHAQGLMHLKKNLMRDVRFQILEEQKHEFPLEAANLALNLGQVLQGMLMRHDIDDHLNGPPNIGKARNLWSRWRSKMQDMFLECLELKAALKLGGEFVEYRWIASGKEFQYHTMEGLDSKQVLDGSLVYFMVFPIIFVPDRAAVLSNGRVVLR